MAVAVLFLMPAIGDRKRPWVRGGIVNARR